VEAMRNSWTDERLDDGFDRVTADIAVLRGEVGSLRKEIGSLRAELKAELKTEIGSVREEMKDLRAELHQAIYSLQRTLFQVAGGIVVALLGVIATQL
jgi:chromosome segregation ATPase